MYDLVRADNASLASHAARDGKPLCGAPVIRKVGNRVTTKARVLQANSSTVPNCQSCAAILAAESGATKHCPLCDRTLPASAFSRRASAKDGLNPLCRNCRGLRRHDRRMRKAAAKAAAEEAK